MTSTAPTPSTPVPSFADVLEPWCAAGVTGALRLPGRSGGAAYLVDGELTYAESRYACGLGRLLPATGRVSAAEIRATRHGVPPMAQRLTGPGLFSAAELEAVVAVALYGAAYFLFDVRAEVRLELGVRHPIGDVVRVGFDAVRAEIDRRRSELYQTFPDATLDTTPVAPVRRLDGDRVALTALQWEIVVAAGRRRTPVDLARALGRDTYRVLLDVRRMVADGLLQPVTTAAPRPVAAENRRRAAARPRPVAESAPVARRAGGTGRRAKPAPATTALPHRGAGTVVPRPVDGAGPDAVFPDSVLLRIRDALQALA